MHVLGTGAAAMHTSTLPLTFEDFKAPNTADVWLALRAQAMSVPMVVLNHGEGWATPVDSRAPSIYMTARGRVSTGMMNVRQIATDAVKRWDDWKVHCPAPVTGRARSRSLSLVRQNSLHYVGVGHSHPTT